MVEHYVQGKVVKTGKMPTNPISMQDHLRQNFTRILKNKNQGLVISFLWSTYVTPLKHMPRSETFLRECFFSSKFVS